MLDATESDKTEDARILLDLLNSVERDGGQSQRRLASELGIALGLVNAYLRRSVKRVCSRRQPRPPVATSIT